LAASRIFAALLITVFLIATFSALAYYASQAPSGRQRTATTLTHPTSTTSAPRTTTTTTSSTTTSYTPVGSNLSIVSVSPEDVNGELKVSAILFYDGPGEVNITYAQVTWPNGTLACSQRLSVPIRHYSNAMIDLNCGVRYVAGDVMLLTVSDSANENATASFRLP